MLNSAFEFLFSLNAAALRVLKKVGSGMWTFGFFSKMFWKVFFQAWASRKQVIWRTQKLWKLNLPYYLKIRTFMRIGADTNTQRALQRIGDRCAVWEQVLINKYIYIFIAYIEYCILAALSTLNGRAGIKADCLIAVTPIRRAVARARDGNCLVGWRSEWLPERWYAGLADGCRVATGHMNPRTRLSATSTPRLIQMFKYYWQLKLPIDLLRSRFNTAQLHPWTHSVK